MRLYLCLFHLLYFRDVLCLGAFGSEFNNGEGLGLALAGHLIPESILPRCAWLKEAHDWVGREGGRVYGDPLAFVCFSRNIRFKFAQLRVSSDRLLDLTLNLMSLNLWRVEIDGLLLTAHHVVNRELKCVE